MTDDPGPGRLPSPLHDRLARLRETAARRVAGAELDRLAARITDLEGGLAQAFAQERKDLLERTDALVASYDQRVAALANRLMDLEDRLAGTGAGAGTRLPVSTPTPSWPSTATRPPPTWRPAAGAAARARVAPVRRPAAPAPARPRPVLGAVRPGGAPQKEGIQARGIEAAPGALVGSLATIADGSLGAVCLLGVVEHLYAGDALMVLRAVVPTLARAGG